MKTPVEQQERKRIKEQWCDEDGYWVALNSGWKDRYNPTSHTIHEDTKREALSIAADAIPCSCKECIADRHPQQTHAEAMRELGLIR